MLLTGGLRPPLAEWQWCNGNQTRHRRLSRRRHRAGPGAGHRMVPHSRSASSTPGQRRRRDRTACARPWPTPPREARANQQTVSRQARASSTAPSSAPTPCSSKIPTLVREIEELIREHGNSPPSTPSAGSCARYAKTLESIDERPLRQPAPPTCSTSKRRILRNLLGHRREQLKHLQEPVIVLAHDLTPSETAALDPRMVHAFATEAGGRASHTAIMAGVLEIPAVVGLGKFVTDVSGGDEVIVDGNRGVLILNPDEETLDRYETVRSSFRTFETQPRRAARPAGRDPGRHAASSCMGNIEFPARRRRTASTAAPTASACIAPSSSIWASRPIPTEAGAPRRLPDRAAHARARTAGGHPHAGPGGRQVRHQQRAGGTRSATRSWACAAFASVCGI